MAEKIKILWLFAFLYFAFIRLGGFFEAGTTQKLWYRRPLHAEASKGRTSEPGATRGTFFPKISSSVGAGAAEVSSSSPRAGGAPAAKVSRPLPRADGGKAAEVFRPPASCSSQCSYPYAATPGGIPTPVEWPMPSPVPDIITADTFRDLAHFVMPWTSPHRTARMCGFANCGGKIQMPSWDSVSGCLPPIPIIFTHGDQASELERIIALNFKKPCIIIGHESDSPASVVMPRGIKNPWIIKFYYHSAGLLQFREKWKWPGDRYRLSQIPIGLNAFFQGGALARYRRNLGLGPGEMRSRFDVSRVVKRQPYVLWSADIQTNPGLRLPLYRKFCERKDFKHIVHCDLRVRRVVGNWTAWNEFYTDISEKYAIWLSPDGHTGSGGPVMKPCSSGHRTHEALYLGMVPIWKNNTGCGDVFASVLDGLPVGRISSWDEVTPKYLSDLAQEHILSQKHRSAVYYAALDPRVWQRRVLAFREKALTAHNLTTQWIDKRCWGRVMA